MHIVSDSGKIQAYSQTVLQKCHIVASFTWNFILHSVLKKLRRNGTRYMKKVKENYGDYWWG